MRKVSVRQALACVVLFLFLSSGVPAWAQSWEELRGLKAGDRIRVLDTAGQEYRGVFTSVSADQISLQTQNSAETIERPRVKRVRVRSTSRRLRKALIGAAVGVAVGVTLDQTLGVRLRNEGNESGRAITYLAPIALIGGLSAAFPSYRTVYQLR